MATATARFAALIGTSVRLLPFLIPAFAASAYPQDGKPGDFVVRVFGNERTDEKVILAAAGLLDDRSMSSANPEEIEQRVRNTRLFSDVEVVFRPDETPPLMFIRIVERWTLTPIPSISSYEGETKVGFDLVEYNFLGLGKTLLFGGRIATRGYNLRMLARDPAIFFSRCSASLSTSYTKYSFREYEGREVIQSYNDEFWQVNLDLGARLGKSATLGCSFTVRHDLINWSSTLRPVSSGWGDMASAWLAYDNTNYHYFFSEGIRVRIEGSWIDEIFGANLRALLATASGHYTLALPKKHCLTVFAYGGLSDGADARFLFKIGGTEGTRGIASQSIWARQYGCAGIQYQIPFFQPVIDRKIFGTCALTGFCEYGSAVRDCGVREVMSVIGVGFRFYLHGFTIPTIAIDILYDPVGHRVMPGIGVGTSW